MSYWWKEGHYWRSADKAAAESTGCAEGRAVAKSEIDTLRQALADARDALGELHDAVGEIVFRDVEERTEVVSPRETIYRATRAMVRAVDVLGGSYRTTARCTCTPTRSDVADDTSCPKHARAALRGEEA